MTTQRSMGNRKVAVPCLTDPVSKLNGCGQQICKNLSDIEEYAGPGMFLPPGFITEVTTGQSLEYCPRQHQLLCCVISALSLYYSN